MVFLLISHVKKNSKRCQDRRLRNPDPGQCIGLGGCPGILQSQFKSGKLWPLVEHPAAVKPNGGLAGHWCDSAGSVRLSDRLGATLNAANSTDS